MALVVMMRTAVIAQKDRDDCGTELGQAATVHSVVVGIMYGYICVHFPWEL